MSAPSRRNFRSGLWDATPASFREIVGQVQSLREENEALRKQFAALLTELASLREWIPRNSRRLEAAFHPPRSDD